VPAFGGVVFGLSRLGESSADEGPTVALVSLAVGVVCLVLFIWRQLRLQRNGSPLLDLRAFHHPMFRLSVALLCTTMISLFGAVIVLPIYLQNVRGLGSLQTGLLLFPGGLLMGLLAPVVGRVFDRYGPRALTTTGATLLTLTLWRFSAVDAATPVWLLVGQHLLFSLGLACLFTPAFTTGLNPLPPSLYSHGSAIISTLQQVAGAAGTALLIAIMAARTRSLAAGGDAELTALNGGISMAFVVASCIAAAGIVVALFMRRPTAAEEQARPAEVAGH